VLSKDGWAKQCQGCVGIISNNAVGRDRNLRFGVKIGGGLGVDVIVRVCEFEIKERGVVKGKGGRGEVCPGGGKRGIYECE